jgi:hypothetical protein
MAETYLLAMRCPVYRRRDSNLGFGRELENLFGDGKGKGTSGRTVRSKVPMRRSRGGLLRSSVETGNAWGAKGAGHSRRTNSRVNCSGRMNPLVRRKAAAFGGWHEPDKSRGLRPVL